MEYFLFYWQRLGDGSRCLLPWWHRKALTQWPPFLNVIVLIRSKVYVCWKWLSFHRHLKYSSQFLGIHFFGNQRDSCFYTAGCVSRMAVSVTGPRTVNELGGPVIPGRCLSPSCESYLSYPRNLSCSIISIIMSSHFL